MQIKALLISFDTTEIRFKQKKTLSSEMLLSQWNLPLLIHAIMLKINWLTLYFSKGYSICVLLVLFQADSSTRPSTSTFWDTELGKRYFRACMHACCIINSYYGVCLLFPSLV